MALIVRPIMTFVGETSVMDKHLIRKIREKNLAEMIYRHQRPKKKKLWKRANEATRKASSIGFVIINKNKLMWLRPLR